MRIRVIKNTTNKVVNIIKVDPANLPQAPNGCRLEDVDAKIGDILVDGSWVADTVAEAAAVAELDARRIERIKAEFDKRDSVSKVLLKISFIQENRIRVLEGQPEITATQFRTWVDGQID